MITKQTIAIIGATGNWGAGLSKNLAKANYRLLLKADNLEELEALVNEIKTKEITADVTIEACTTEAGWEADIIILAVPFSAEKEIACKIKEVANQKIVISFNNNTIDANNGWLNSLPGNVAEELQQLLPNSKVVKAFNAGFAGDFTTKRRKGSATDSFIVGNDEEALQTVSELLETAGLHPYIA